jgi:hypothetical protein
VDCVRWAAMQAREEYSIDGLAVSTKYPISHIPSRSAVCLRSSSPRRLARCHQPFSADRSIALTLPPTHSPHGLGSTPFARIARRLSALLHISLAPLPSLASRRRCVRLRFWLHSGRRTRARLFVCLLACCVLLPCVRALVGPGIIIGTGIRQGAAWIKRRTAADFGGLRHAPYAYTTL